MFKLNPEKIRSTRARALRHMENHDPASAADALGKLAGQGYLDPDFLCELASAHHANADFSATEACLARLLKLYPGNGLAHNFAGRLLYRMRRPEAALLAYAGVEKKDDPDGITRLEMVAILERQGRLDEAGELVREVLRAKPSSASARHLAAVVTGREGKSDTAIDAFRDLLAGDIGIEIRGAAGHALAALLDKQGDYAGAIRVLLDTKAAMEAANPEGVARARALSAKKSAAVRKLTEQLTAEHIRRWRDAPRAAPMRGAILAGHPRSGTTLLESILDSHSGIVSVEETECMENQVFHAVFNRPVGPELFDAGFLDRLPEAAVEKARRGYRRAMEQFPTEPAGDRLILDKNPILTQFLGAGARFFPEMKLIVSLRDPRDVCLSCFQQSVGINRTNVPWLRIDETMRLYNDIMGVWLRLRELLPDGFHEVRYERLVEDTPGMIRGTLDFLGLPWEEAAMNRGEGGKKRTIYSPTYAQAAKPVYKSALRRWENYADPLEPHLHILDTAVDRLGYR